MGTIKDSNERQVQEKVEDANNIKGGKSMVCLHGCKACRDCKVRELQTEGIAAECGGRFKEHAISETDLRPV